jgi:hypothetical protein
VARLENWLFNGTMEQRRDRPDKGPIWTNPIVIGTTEPIGGTNVGMGFYENRPEPSVTISTGTGITFNNTTKAYAISTTVEDRVIPGFVDLTSTGYLINCHVIGPAVEITTGNRALVAGPSSGQGRVDWCTIDPQTPSAYYDGFGHGIWARFCDVKNVIDGVRGHSTSVNGFRGKFEACEFHHAVQFAPDYANGNRQETHNDVLIQCQGNPNAPGATALLKCADIFFDGCRGNARHSTTKGDIPPYRDQIAAIMMTPAVGPCYMTFTRGWLYGGIYCVNAGSNELNDGSALIITDTRFEKPGTDAFGDGRAPDIALGLDSGLIRTASGNTYISDGTNVSVSSV